MQCSYAYRNASRQRSSKPPKTYTLIKILHAVVVFVWKWHCACPGPVLTFGILEPPSLSLCCFVKESQIDGHWADRSRCCKHRCTVRKQTGRAAKMSIFSIMVHDVITCFFRADLTVCSFSQPLVIGERSEPACRSGWPSATHWLHIRMAVEDCRPVRRTISQNDNPHLNR